MKHKILLCLLLTGLCLAPLAASDLQVGLLGGLRTVAQESFSDAYGSGIRLTPFLALPVGDALDIGAAFSLNLFKDAPIGLLEDDSSFSLTSLEVFGRYRFESGAFDPYAKLGLGLHFYAQTSETAQIDFSKTGMGVFLGAGGEYALNDQVSLLAELGYTVLSVKPFEDSINLGGLTIQAGLAYRFAL